MFYMTTSPIRNVFHYLGLFLFGGSGETEKKSVILVDPDDNIAIHHHSQLLCIFFWKTCSVLTLQMPFWRPLPFDIFSLVASFSRQQRPFSGSWLRCHCSSNSYFLTSRLNSRWKHSRNGCFKAIKTYFNLFCSISDFFQANETYF